EVSGRELDLSGVDVQDVDAQHMGLALATATNELTPDGAVLRSARGGAAPAPVPSERAVALAGLRAGAGSLSPKQSVAVRGAWLKRLFAGERANAAESEDPVETRGVLSADASAPQTLGRARSEDSARSTIPAVPSVAAA